MEITVQKTLTKILKFLKLTPSIPTFKKLFFPKIIPKSKFVYFLEKMFPKNYSKEPKSFFPALGGINSDFTEVTDTAYSFNLLN